MLVLVMFVFGVGVGMVFGESIRGFFGEDGGEWSRLPMTSGRK